MKKKRKSFAQQTRENIKRVRDEIQAVFKLTDEEYFEIQLEHGLMYLEHIMGNDQQGINDLKLSDNFWNWFRWEWYKRDKELVRSITVENGVYNHHRPMYTQYEDEQGKWEIIIMMFHDIDKWQNHYKAIHSPVALVKNDVKPYDNLLEVIKSNQIKI